MPEAKCHIVRLVSVLSCQRGHSQSRTGADEPLTALKAATRRPTRFKTSGFCHPAWTNAFGLSVKKLGFDMSARERVFKAVALLSALSVLWGCQTTQNGANIDEYVWPHRYEVAVAKVVVSNCKTFSLGKCGRNFEIAVVGVDGKRISASRRDGEGPYSEAFVDVQPGEHVIHVAVRWSNGVISVGGLQLTAERGEVYRVYAYEVDDVSELSAANPARKPVPPPSGSSDLAGGLGFAFMVAMPWYLPAMFLVYLPFKLHGDAREQTFRSTPEGTTGALPFEKCCWYWIEDGSGKVVSGSKVRAQ